MKIMKLLALSSFGVVAVLATATACLGSEIQACAETSECAEGQVCDGSQCILAADPVCSDDTDCDLANSESPSFANDCTDVASCTAADAARCGGQICECVEDGVGAKYCVRADSDNVGEGCEEINGNYKAVEVSGKAICVAEGDDACDEDGQCN